MACPKVVIEVEGGMVQAVVSDQPIDAYIIDRDNEKVGEPVGPFYVDVECKPRLVKKKLKEAEE